MIPNAVEVRLSPEDRAVLEARLRAPTAEQRQVFRAQVVLLAADGRSTRTKLSYQPPKLFVLMPVSDVPYR